MILQHLSLLLFLGVACCLAQHNVEALGELKKAHVDVRSKLSKQWASDPPDLQQLLCAKAEHAGHVVKNSRVEASPTIRLSRSGIDKLKSASVPVYTACQVPPPLCRLLNPVGTLHKQSHCKKAATFFNKQPHLLYVQLVCWPLRKCRDDTRSRSHAYPHE